MTTPSRFCRYELRTTDVNAARAFYIDVFGAQFWDAEVLVSPLPARAAAQGAPAHWLGHLGVGDVEAAAAEIVARGGQRLGPTQLGDDGSRLAVLRDPFGAVIGVSSAGSEPVGARRAAVAWQLSHSRDHERAFAMYAALFGWTASEPLDLGSEIDRHQPFAWDDSGRGAGSMASITGRPHIHEHWLFFFRVDDIASAVARVRARGGLVVSTTQLPSGDLVAPCDDPQGAAFGLYQFARG